jgi:hypothetical protein
VLAVLTICSPPLFSPKPGSELDADSQRASFYYDVGGRFELPDDHAGKMLSRLLPPRDVLAVELEQAGKQRKLSDRHRLRLPLLPPPPSESDPPHLPLAPSERLGPQLVLDEMLDELPEPGSPPAAPLPDGVRASAATAGPRTDLQPLAQPTPDRVSLDDVTGPASTAAALAAPLPPRSSLAPFQRLTVPDPFERRREQPLPEVAEEAAPQTTSPRVPGR